MNSPLASFVGRNLPISVWNSKVLYLPEPLATAHKDFLNDKGWMSAYQPVLGGGTGGQSSKEAQDHVLNNHQLKLVGLGYGLKVRIRVA